jgi:hypothetical protein
MKDKKNIPKLVVVMMFWSFVADGSQCHRLTHSGQGGASQPVDH